MLRFWIIDNIYEKLEKQLFFDGYDCEGIHICGYYSDETQNLLKEAICNYHYLFSEENKGEQSDAYFQIGEHDIANRILEESADNDGIIDKMFGKYLGPILIIKDGKGYFTNGHDFNEHYEIYTFGFDMDGARSDRDEFINGLNLTPMIEEIKEYNLTHSWDEFTEKYPYDYTL